MSSYLNVYILIAVMFLSACGRSPEKPDITIDEFSKCINSDDAYYKDNCESKTLVVNAIIKSSHDLSVVKTCSILKSEYLSEGREKNLTYGFYNDNKERCMKVFAELGSRSDRVFNISVIEVISIEKNEEVESRKLRDEKLMSEIKAAELELNKNNAEWLHKNYKAIATYYCQEKVENLAKYDFEWTDTWREDKFDSFIVRVNAPYILTITGDKIKFQNGFGAWIRLEYSCAYDVKQSIALWAEVK